eukprot:CAMPEP_0180786870 /NCGR_PEP_ID=MMETSP1038_2-20121128/51054_1 /TAXON_ID=632150 /ORGANISM="Azadinium spinosum, Strain 3D9" /LENGTH=158 /DNA_ID=CAMNT_0022824067 /DNA_START=18 /DNA_END=489 /DNA_ORIENTATION=+
MALATAFCLARHPPGRFGPTPSGTEPREVVLQISSGLSSEPLFALPADLGSRIGDIKALVERLEGTPARQQRLLVGGRQLCSGRGGDSGSAVSLRAEGGEAGIASATSGPPGSSSALSSGDCLTLEEALGGPPLAVPGAVVEVSLVRLAPAWAELLEG